MLRDEASVKEAAMVTEKFPVRSEDAEKRQMEEIENRWIDRQTDRCGRYRHK